MAKKTAKKTAKRKVFKTADGKVIKAGMVVWLPPPKGDDSFLMHCEKVAKVDTQGPISGYLGTVFRGGRIIPEAVYSSHEAANKAKAKR